MHGDFSLNPLAYRRDVSRVLFQQGRVQLDSDVNEQTESQLRFLRGLAMDTFGAHGGIGTSFEIIPKTAAPALDVLIRWGVYYVDGIRCVNEPDGFDILNVGANGWKGADGLSFRNQPNYFVTEEDKWNANEPLLLYLDVFEHHISAAEDDNLREVALLGPDTASRSVVVWQVRAMPAKAFIDRLASLKTLPEPWAGTWDNPYIALNLVLRSNALMRARATLTETTDPCTISPDARYRGVENRLFRVEIHDSGIAGKSQPTFKWSPDNGAIVYPLRQKVDGPIIHLSSLGRDDRTSIRVNDWVEVVDRRTLLMGVTNPLLQVVGVDPHQMTATLREKPKDNVGNDLKLDPILRRWATAPLPLREGNGDRDGWFELSDGVEVQFSHAKTPDFSHRSGDYWLVPARTATGDVIWPPDSGDPIFVAPHGIGHHYAPLAIVTGLKIEDYRRHFQPSAAAAESHKE
jgi:hypothetical protein